MTNLTRALLDRLYSALEEQYPDSFYLLVEWFEDYDIDRFMLDSVKADGFIEVIDLDTAHYLRRERYKALAFMVSLGFELRRRAGRDVVHYHCVPPDVMFRLREYIRIVRADIDPFETIVHNRVHNQP